VGLPRPTLFLVSAWNKPLLASFTKNFQKNFQNLLYAEDQLSVPFTIVVTTAGRIVSLSTISVERIGDWYIGQVAYFAYSGWRILRTPGGHTCDYLGVALSLLAHTLEAGCL
jgi:hypothetical protein